MARSTWQFYDPITTDVYSWPVNPSEDNGSHAITRNTKYEANAGLRQDSGGQVRIDNIVAYGSDAPQTFTYSGAVYDQAQLESLEEWSDKDYAVILTDDLGRQFYILIQELELTRVRSRQNPYKHSYKFSGLILEEI